MLPRLEKQIVRVSAAEVEAILRRQQGEPQTAEAQRKDLLRDPDAPEGCWEKETVRAMKKVTPGCVVLVTRVRETESETVRDEPRRKKAKKEKKEKKEKREKGEAREDADAVLATKAAGGHLRHQLAERSAGV